MIENNFSEKPKESLSFLHQLQNQIQLCREALSDRKIPLTPRVEALETLLWAKLKDDKNYFSELEKLKDELIQRKNNIKLKNPDINDWQFREALIPHLREKAKGQFKAIIIFIDKKGLMPIDEQS